MRQIQIAFVEMDRLRPDFGDEKCHVIMVQFSADMRPDRVDGSITDCRNRTPGLDRRNRVYQARDLK